MSQNSTEERYPRDRFDEVEPYTTQQGAHRKEFTKPVGAGHLNAIIVAGGVALAVGVGSFLWLQPSDPLNQAGSEPQATVSEPVEESPEPEAPEGLEDPDEDAEAEPTDEPGAIELEDPGETDEPEGLDEAEEPEGEVDYELPIGVYNASSVQGHAASVAQDLGGAGFNVPVAENWTGTTPASTTVYFSDNEATAEAVAEELGAAVIEEPSVDGVVVVLTAE